MSLRVRVDKRRKRRVLRVRGRLLNVDSKPRVSVCRSLRHIYAQIIDDCKGRTLVSFSSLCKGVGCSGDASSVAKSVGLELGKLAVAKNVAEVVFDRGSCLYHGRVKALADGLRESGLKF
ncbi:50S ribosomal protein L18 [Candidatus Babeliales bacterium]|nr:50S ribosomal protein L18 [Candidatus Babeliales bacterium]